MKLKVTPAYGTTRMLFLTTRITAVLNDNTESVGTGFFYNSGKHEYLVTNKHVIENAAKIDFTLHSVTSGDHHSQYVNLGAYSNCTTNPKDWIHHPDPEIDLCCLDVKYIHSQLKKDLRFHLSISSGEIAEQKSLKNVPASMQVAMIGYPNGLWDKENGLPIIRKGTTASHPAVQFNGKEEILLDMACFPGSSGSPIMFDEPKFFASAPRFLGVLYAGPTIESSGQILASKIPTTSTAKSVSIQTMMHLGYVITANKVQELSEYIS